MADAHVGATVRALGGDDIVVLSSDPLDMAKVCDTTRATIVAI